MLFNPNINHSDISGILIDAIRSGVTSGTPKIYTHALNNPVLVQRKSDKSPFVFRELWLDLLPL